ncbi:MAG: translation elongation factor Ts [Candidatus Chisholmbacteria bacterium RIFCSPHIGHO2_12_FULL_49_9]|uniref:Elongation factor Ts n=1 Tax=Candidatus Chisholmbacteria bacterium RIFCSPHIGHO2_01_FULL_52_32 TaxID=1797591 RepID=A0A1G1VS57_9BACT|nr:MAG: translation elongation factor Ts [Candidatus Chisholmbacteria bacterium RIFCSPHIGHO2_01_FULL_52_32]OGY19267.1 MAG: translation elongation factor Ts [Candidatus Chisholmbacteria bacterium RIFCSPHIGHO2_12_FULL_49_9]OGY20385.1 MAG: translation elongation factor Ts [Candidatus Chisholmbacteria bacterium RIFCSPLOWO2_01_FULL_50_28]
MTKITIEQIKKLREKTGVGVMEAKKALEEGGGDEKKAIAWIQKHGLMKAAAKAKRKAGEGLIASYIHHGGKVAALVEFACETDFVARTEEFGRLARELAMQVASMDPKDVAELLKQEYIREVGKTVEQLIAEVVGKTGEKIEVKRFVRWELAEK